MIFPLIIVAFQKGRKPAKHFVMEKKTWDNYSAIILVAKGIGRKEAGEAGTLCTNPLEADPEPISMQANNKGFIAWQTRGTSSSRHRTLRRPDFLP